MENQSCSICSREYDLELFDSDAYIEIYDTSDRFLPMWLCPDCTAWLIRRMADRKRRIEKRRDENARRSQDDNEHGKGRAAN